MNTPPIPTLAAAGQLRWLTRRGMKELDVLLEPYFAHEYPQLSPTQQATFIHILQTWEDPDLYACLMGQAPAPTAETAETIAHIAGYQMRRRGLA